LKLLQENIGKTLEDIGIGNYFLNITPITQEIRARIASLEKCTVVAIEIVGFYQI
jgi:hypothetical protein